MLVLQLEHVRCDLLDLLLERGHLAAERRIGADLLRQLLNGTGFVRIVLFYLRDELLVYLDLLFVLLFDALQMLFKILLIDEVLLVLRAVSELEAEFVEVRTRQVNVPVGVGLVEELVEIVPDLVSGLIKTVWQQWISPW